MSDTTVKPISSTEKERQEVLHRIWLAQAKALAAALENTPAGELQAATLNVARQFLTDNGITTDSLKQNSYGGEGPSWARGTMFEGKTAAEIQAAVEEMDEFGPDLPPADPA